MIPVITWYFRERENFQTDTQKNQCNKVNNSGTCWLKESILLVNCSLDTGLEGGNMVPAVSDGPGAGPDGVVALSVVDGGVGVPLPSSSVDMLPSVLFPAVASILIYAGLLFD